MINPFNKKKKQNEGFQTLHRIKKLVNGLSEKTKLLNLNLSETDIKRNPTKKEIAQYEEIIDRWERLSKLEFLIPYNNYYPNATIIRIFSPYTNQKLQKHTTSLKVMLDNLKLLDHFLDKILGEMEHLRKNYDFEKIYEDK